MIAGLYLRIATIEDADEVTALLESSYSILLKSGNEPDVLAKALPFMTRANSKLLASGKFYVVHSTDGRLVGCGGWSMEQPGTGEVKAGEGHIRHFAVDPVWTRKGIGSLILAHCFDEAKARGVKRLECQSSLAAESFYHSAGFETVASFILKLAPDVSFPGVLMRKNLTPN